MLPRGFLILRCFGIVWLQLIATSSSSAAFCYEPSFYESAPTPPGIYSKPDVPYCLTEYSWRGKHSCDEWELRSYISEVEDYVDELNEFSREARAFAEAAILLVNEASTYSHCEADEVNSQHE